VRLWDVRSGTEHRVVSGPKERAQHLAFHSNGKSLAIVCNDRTAEVRDIATGSLVASMPLSGRPRCCLFSPDGQWFLTAASAHDNTDDSEVWAWPVASYSAPTKVLGPIDTVRSMAFSHEGSTLALASGNRILLVDWTRRSPPVTLQGGSGAINSLRFTPNELWLIAGDSNGQIRIWDWQSRKQIHDFSAHASMIMALVCHPTQPRLFSAGFDATIKVWSLPAGEEIVSLSGHSNFVRSLAITPDGNKLFSASSDGTVRIWDGTPAHGNR
jgi:WD40 repeat protein